MGKNNFLAAMDFSKNPKADLTKSIKKEIPFFDHTDYFIDEKSNTFKWGNTYQIFNSKGKEIGTVSQNVSTSEKIWRVLINKAIVPFSLEVRSTDGQLQATISKGWSFMRPEVAITDSKNQRVGSIEKKLSLGRSNFKILDSGGSQIAGIKGSLASWDFEIKDMKGSQLGKISKKWAGLAKEIFTTQDKYNVHIDSKLTQQDNRISILVSAIAIDMILKNG